MRHFRVIVNGLAYEVDVEELTGHAEHVAATDQAPQRMPLPGPAAARPAVVAAGPTDKAAAPDTPVAAAAGGGSMVSAPLPGGVLDIKVAVGETVREGQVLVILEAMKMENEIVAPRAGTVAEVRVKPGDAVSVGDVLVVIGT